MKINISFELTGTSLTPKEVEKIIKENIDHLEDWIEEFYDYFDGEEIEISEDLEITVK